MQQQHRLAGTQVYRCALGHAADTKGDTAGTARRSATVCPVIVSTINVNGIRAAIKQRSSENLGLLPYALRWSDHATVTVEYR